MQTDPGLFLVVGLAFPQLASAGPKRLPAIGSAVGMVTSFDPVNGVQTALATGRGSILGIHTNSITIFFDFETGETWGFFEVVAEHNSASAAGTFTGSFVPIDGTPLFAFFLTATFEEGSGILEGVSGGEIEIDAVQNTLTGEVEYEYRGEFEFG